MPSKVKEATFSSFDGTKIHYRVAGKGAKAIFCCNGVGVAKWIWQPLEKYFSDRYKIITWDYRGHGLSEPVKNPATTVFSNLVDDAVELIKYLNLKKVYLIGHSAGFHVSLEILRRKPAFAEKLISCMGTPGKSLETFMESFIGQLVFDAGYILNAVLPETSHIVNTNLLRNPATYQIGAALRLVNPAIEGKNEIDRYLEHITRMDFSLFNHLVASGSKTSAEDMFGKIKKPTLVIAAEYDRFVPVKIAKSIHAGIKKSEMFIIKNGTHAALLEQPDVFNLLIERFLSGRA